MNTLEMPIQPIPKLLDNYLNQIIDVSAVATIKVYLFALSLKLAAASLIVVLFSLLVA